jgi:hypothetical protein
MPSLALLTLAGMTPPRHQVSNFEEGDIASWPPAGFDLAAMAVSARRMRDACGLAADCIARGVPVVMGDSR